MSNGLSKCKPRPPLAKGCGPKKPKPVKVEEWEYSFYRASLYRNGKRFAIVTTDDRRALSLKDTDELLEALNGRKPFSK